ncbi:MAG: cold-shock protein [Bdellovibrionales bacterium]
MRSGRIKWFNAFQSIGYIILLDGTEVYFHVSAVRSSDLIGLLNPGAEVSFDLIETRSGMEAHNVDLVG